MDAGKVIAYLLNSNADLSAIVGDKIYPLVIDEHRVYPAVVYGIESSPLQAKDILPEREVRVKIDCYGKTYAESKAIAAQVEKSLHGYEGQVNNILVKYLALENASDGHFEDKGVKLFQDSQDFKMIAL